MCEKASGDGVWIRTNDTKDNATSMRHGNMPAREAASRAARTATKSHGDDKVS